MKFALVGLMALLAALAVTPAVAEESPLALRLFGTLGAVRSSSGDADFLRDLSQQRGAAADDWHLRVDSMLGVQANLRLTPELDAVAQMVSRPHEINSLTPELELGFLRYEPSPSLVLRLGRLGADLYLQSDSRSVGYANLAVRPPVDVFGGLPLFHLDGVDLSGAMPAAGGLAQARVYSGLADEKVPIEGQLWDLKGSRVTGINLDYHRQPWSARLGYGQLQFRRGFPMEDQLDALRQTGVPSAMAAADNLALQGKKGRFLSLGLIHDEGPLVVQGMLGRIRYDTATYENSRFGYVLGGYRIGVWTPYLGYSWIHSKSHGLSAGLPDVFPLNQLNDMVVRWQYLSRANQNTRTLGVRWDFMRQAALKLQWDEIRGSPDSIYLYKQVSPAWRGRTDVLSVSLDFTF